MREGGDYVDVIEAAYRLEADEGTWLEELAGAVARAVPRSAGVWTMLYDASAATHTRVGRLHHIGTPPGPVPGLITRLLATDRAGATFGTASCALASEVDDEPRRARIASDVLAHARAHGVSDVLGLNGADPSGAGVFIGVSLDDRRTRGLSRQMRDLGARLAAHASTAYRLRRRLASAGAGAASVLDDGEAVFKAGGRLGHAEDAAKPRAAQKELRAAVLEIDRARGGLRRRTPAAAVAGWRALVAARWTLVDHFAHDGQRYVVARRNEAAAPSLDALSERERQVVAFAMLGHPNKLIAYELGLATSTVGVLLSRAMAKLGVRSRKELLEALRPRSRDDG